jgi:hypothetical protein
VGWIHASPTDWSAFAINVSFDVIPERSGSEGPESPAMKEVIPGIFLRFATENPGMTVLMDIFLR